MQVERHHERSSYGMECDFRYVIVFVHDLIKRNILLLNMYSLKSLHLSLSEKTTFQRYLDHRFSVLRFRLLNNIVLHVDFLDFNRIFGCDS